jgi:hypothetical protein
MIAPKVKVAFTTFDRSIIRRNWSNINRTPIARGGMLIRRRARQSIRRVGPNAKPSAPGTPPKSRVKGGTAPFKMIYSVPSASGTSAIVGMVGFGSGNPAPGIQEHGGSATRTLTKKAKPGRDSRGKFLKAKSYRIKKRVVIEPRPFMSPALQDVAPMIPALYRGSLAANQVRGRV